MAIPREKLLLHLRLGRELVQAVGIGSYFEEPTFDWVKLEPGEGTAVRAVLVRSFDEGDEWANGVATFGTLNKLEPEGAQRHAGTLASCLVWAQERGADPDGFSTGADLDASYARYAAQRDDA